MDELIFKNKTSIDCGELLNEGEIHLWWLSLSIDLVQLAYFESLLSEHQRARMQRLANEQQRKNYIAGRGYLNQLLMQYLPASASIELSFGPHGKPALKDNIDNLYFNYTDTGGYGLFAFSRSSELGIDVENLQRAGKFSRIIQRRFAEQEQYIAELDSADFLKCWTRKEAYGKAIGAGLNYPLREQLLCENLAVNEFQSDDKQWFGQQFYINQRLNKERLSEQKFVACVFSKSNQPKGVQAYQVVEIDRD